MAERTQGVDTIDPVHNIPPAGFDPHAGKTLLGHPSGLFLLFIVEMWERFSYYGMRSLLILYMVSVIAVHQLAPGVYTNTLTYEELNPTDKNNVIASREIPFQLRIGSQEAAPAPVAGAATGTPSLVFTRLKEGPKDASGNPTWVADEAATDPLAPVIISGAQGAKGQFNNREVRYAISNPTQSDVEVRFTVAPDPVDKRAYIKPNGSQGKSLNLKIKPDSKRAASERPVELVVATNDHDSGRNWTSSAASTMYGWYTGLAYLFPLIGGILADKFIGTHRSMVLGGLLIALGHIVLGISGIGELAQNSLGLSTFIGGLALVILGTGHFKPCVSTMVGELYKPGDPRRDGGFSIFYMGINLGAFLCAFVCGTLGEKVGWHWGFGSAAVGMVAGLLIYLVGRPRLLSHVGNKPAGKPDISILLFFISCAIAAAFAYAFHGGALASLNDLISKLNEPGNEALRNGLVFGLLFAVIVSVALFVMKQKPGDKAPTASIFLFMLFNAFFWVAFEQAGSSMNVFTEQNTSRVLFGYEIPATWFQSINAGLIILLAPVFAALWGWLGARRMNPTQPAKIAFGLILLALGFIFMVQGARLALTGQLVSPIWIFAAYLFHTMGELCLSPTGLSYVTKAAPVRFVSLLMGIWFISSFIANLGGGLIAAKVEAIERGEVKLPWNLGGSADFFMLFVIVPGGVGLLVLLFTPLLKKMLRNQND